MAADEAAEATTTETIPEWKREEVETIAELVGSHGTVGVVGVAGVPSRQLQEMRANLHGSAVLRMGRNTLLRRALEQVDEGVETLVDDVTGQVGVVASDENPFSLFRTLEETKTPAPINAGEIAPNDIVIEAGDTGIDPGPFVGELQQVGADARIQEGSIQVLSDSVVCEAGEAVSQDLANVLSELGIEPKEVGLDLRSVYADGVLFDPEELAIDLDDYRADFETAAARARNLSVESSYPTDRTAGTLLSVAAGRARSVGLAGAVESPELADDLIGKADAQLRALAARVDDPDALPEQLRDADLEPQSEAGEEAVGADEETEDTDADEPETAADADGDGDGDANEDDDDDDGDAAEGLGNMFG